MARAGVAVTTSLRQPCRRDASCNNTLVWETAPVACGMHRIGLRKTGSARPGLLGSRSTAASAPPVPHSRPGFRCQRQQYAHQSETS